MAIVQAVNRTTGKKQWVPEHWVGQIIAGQEFTQTPRQKAAQTPRAGASVAEAPKNTIEPAESAGDVKEN